MPKELMSERDFQTEVIKFAKMLGWVYYHTHLSKNSVAGFPDLVLAKDRILYRELKSEKGRLTKDQKMWGERLRAAGGDWQVWRPSQLEQIYEELLR